MLKKHKRWERAVFLWLDRKGRQMSIEKEEQQYLEMVITKVREKISHMTEKMENNVKDMESMHDYFWENYTEFDEYGYEMYDNKQALKVRLTQQEEYSLDAKRYNKMLDSPYFGRVDFRYDGEDEPEIYLYWNC